MDLDLSIFKYFDKKQAKNDKQDKPFLAMIPMSGKVLGGTFRADSVSTRNAKHF